VRPRDAVLLLGGFAALLGAWWAVLVAWDTDLLATALLGGAAAACLLAAPAFAVRAPRRRARDVRADPDLSLGAPALAVGVAALLLGAELGQWLLLIGAGATVGGVALLVREVRSARRALERVTRERDRCAGPVWPTCSAAGSRWRRR
jgi:hypothetical protein